MVEQVLHHFATGARRDTLAENVRYDLISPYGLARLAATYAEGADKYGGDNWRKGLPWSNILNHLIMHVESWKAGDRTEDHLAHAAWGLFALMEYETTHRELNDLYFKAEEDTSEGSDHTNVK